MKTLIDHINEALKIGKNISKFSTYAYKPTSKKELQDIIKVRIKKDGPNCNLNDIDVSLIEDMSYLFYELDFNGDISNWDVSNVKSMMGMFLYSPFNGDISKWNISRVNKMSGMFLGSKFNQDISNWKINKDCVRFNMFDYCPIKEEYKPKTL